MLKITTGSYKEARPARPLLIMNSLSPATDSQSVGFRLVWNDPDNRSRRSNGTEKIFLSSLSKRFQQGLSGSLAKLSDTRADGWQRLDRVEKIRPKQSTLITRCGGNERVSRAAMCCQMSMDPLLLNQSKFKGRAMQTSVVIRLT